MEKKRFTITAFTENHIGILNRLTIIFTRRHINIESLTVSESEMHGISRFTIVIIEQEDLVSKVVKQIDRMVEVLRTSYYEDKDIIYQEIALYKVKTSAFTDGNHVEKVIRAHNARILRIEKEYVIIEKTGHLEETQELFEVLSPYGVLQFVRSGRVALTKEIKEFKNYLKEIDERQKKANKQII